MQNFNCFECAYFGPTNSRGSRVRIKNKRFDETVFIPFDHAFNNIEDIASAYLTKKGFNVVGIGYDLVITDTFKSMKE